MNVMSGSKATLTHQFVTLDNPVTPISVILDVMLPDGTTAAPAATITTAASATPVATALVDFSTVAVLIHYIGV